MDPLSCRLSAVIAARGPPCTLPKQEKLVFPIMLFDPGGRRLRDWSRHLEWTAKQGSLNNTQGGATRGYEPQKGHLHQGRRSPIANNEVKFNLSKHRPFFVVLAL